MINLDDLEKKAKAAMTDWCNCRLYVASASPDVVLALVRIAKAADYYINRPSCDDDECQCGEFASEELIEALKAITGGGG